MKDLDEAELQNAGRILALQTLIAECLAVAHKMNMESIMSSRDAIYRLMDDAMMSDDDSRNSVFSHAIRYCDQVFDTAADLARRRRG
jgi:hypothetical protein